MTAFVTQIKSTALPVEVGIGIELDISRQPSAFSEKLFADG